MNFESQIIIKPSEEDFEVINFLGRGSYGQVYQVRKKCGQDENQIYAMKIINKNKIAKKKRKIDHAFTEKNVLKSIDHPFIVKIIYSFQSETKLHLILEYLCGGDLKNLLNREKILPESSARFYITEIILAIEYLHSRDIIYRDLKPANILLDKYGHIKIVDFGLSKENMFNNKKTYTKCGTLNYAAPEILNQEGHSKEVDWWSLGIIIFKMLTGVHAFKETLDHNILAYSIIRGHYFFPPNCALQPAAKDLIQLLLIVNPEMRLGSSGAEDIKTHSFFKKTRWDEVVKRLQKPPHLPQFEIMADDSEIEKNDSKKCTSSDLVPLSVITKSQNELFNGFSFTSAETLELANKKSDSNYLYDEAMLLGHNATIRKRISNAFKSVKSFFNKRS